MNICRQCFREKSQDIGFVKVGFHDLFLSFNFSAPDRGLFPLYTIGGLFLFSRSRNTSAIFGLKRFHLTWTSFLNSTGEFVRISCFKSFDVHDSFPCSALGKIDLIPWEKKGAKRKKKQMKSTNGRTVNRDSRAEFLGIPRWARTFS